MASIRLFGRGRNAAAAGGPAVGAALIADALESLAVASMSTTWRCRHSAGVSVSIGEGAVDFAAGRSRSTVIRGKYAFEYVRSGASVYRATVTDVEGSAPAQTRAGVDASEAADEDEDELESELAVEDGDDDEIDDGDEDDVVIDGAADASGSEREDSDDEAGEDTESEDDAESEVEAQFEDDDADEGDVEDGEDSEGGEDEASQESLEPVSASVAASSVSAVVSSAAGSDSVWERFSQHDACGVHAYAEPAVLAAGVRASGAVQSRDAEEFDGVKLSAFAVTLKPKPGDPNRVLARLARQLRDHGAYVVVVTAFVDESAATDSDDDGEEEGAAGEGGPRIVRLRIELPHWTPADDPTADHSVSVDLYEFGEPVSVQVPEGAVRRTARSCADLALF